MDIYCTYCNYRRRLSNKLNKTFPRLCDMWDWVLCHILHPNRFISIEAYSQRHPNKAIVLERFNQTFFFARENESGEKDFAREPIPGCVVRFSNASCFSQSDIILLHNNQCIYEIRDYYKSKGKNINAADNAVLMRDDKSSYALRIPYYTRTLVRGICMCGLFAYNYYHFTMSILPRFRFLSQIDADVPLLVDKAVMDTPNLRQLLDWLNTDNREIIVLEPNTRYKVHELYYVSTQMISVPNYQKGAVKEPDDDMYSYEALTFLRETLLPHQDANWNPPIHVFLSRTKSGVKSRTFNEEECIAALKERGFVEVSPEKLTVSQQIKLFQTSKCIIGGTGASFTNLLYGNPNGQYIILRGKKNRSTVWASLALFSKLSMNIIDADSNELLNAAAEHESYTIDVTNILKMIKL